MKAHLKSEGRNPKAERRPKAEGRNLEPLNSDFGFRASFGLRISAFGFHTGFHPRPSIIP
jgi:hypothetical protein